MTLTLRLGIRPGLPNRPYNTPRTTDISSQYVLTRVKARIHDARCVSDTALRSGAFVRLGGSSEWFPLSRPRPVVPYRFGLIKEWNPDWDIPATYSVSNSEPNASGPLTSFVDNSYEDQIATSISAPMLT